MNKISTISKKINIAALYAWEGKYDVIFSRGKLSVKHPVNKLINVITPEKMLANLFSVFHNGQYNSVNKPVFQ